MVFFVVMAWFHAGENTSQKSTLFSDLPECAMLYLRRFFFPVFFLTERTGYYPGAAAHATCEGLSLELLYHLPAWLHRMTGYTGETCGHRRLVSSSYLPVLHASEI